MSTTRKIMSEPDADQFRIGDVWESPRGTSYQVTDLIYIKSKPRKHAVLRAGPDGTGKRIVRAWDAIGTISSGSFWVRIKSGHTN